jgi:phosphoglycerate kinase
MIKSITSVKVTGKRVVVRAGFDVQLEQHIQTEEPKVVDDTRIRDILPTIKYLVEQKAKIVILSHLGRPDGWDDSKCMWPVAEKLGELLKYKTVSIKDKLPEYDIPHVYFLSGDITKKDYSALSKKIQPGSILFLENIRFYKGEQDNDEKFIKTLVKFGDIFVNEAFSVSHRTEASTYGVAKALPHYAGVSLLKEISALNKILHNPAKPLIVIMGGAKVTDKEATIHNLAKHADHILVGGAIGNSFLAASGYETGKSKVDDIPLAKELLRNYKDKIILPVDVVVAKSEDDENPRSVDISKILPTDIMYDIGPKTVTKFSQYIKGSKTLVWNGPMGLIEKKKFSNGSAALAMAFASHAKGKAFGVVGGGETIEVVDRAQVVQFIDHVSTGGGAMLEFLAGKKLPAIEILES